MNWSVSEVSLDIFPSSANFRITEFISKGLIQLKFHADRENFSMVNSKHPFKTVSNKSSRNVLFLTGKTVSVYAHVHIWNYCCTTTPYFQANTVPTNTPTSGPIKQAAVVFHCSQHYVQKCTKRIETRVEKKKKKKNIHYI